jgi:hypothetical protein
VRSNAPSIHILKGAWNVPCARYQNKSGNDTCVMKNSSKSTHFELVYKDKCIRHEGDLICLTDLWKVSGQPSGKRDPRRWKKESGQEFIDSVSQKLNVRSADIYKTTRGRGGASWGHWQIALAYAKYLSPELHMHVNEIYMRYQSGDVALADEVVDKMAPEQQELHAARTLGKVARNFLTKTLDAHEVKGYGYVHCTNSTYKGLFGKNAKQLREERNLPVRKNVRDHMDIEELLSVGLSEILAKKEIETDSIYGNKPCANSCYRNASKVQSIL